jgi:hypothetical protein
MIDAALLEEIRRVLNAFKRPEWQRDLERAVPTDLVRDIVADNRHPIHPAQDPSAKVSVMGAGRVIDGNDTPVASNGTGWVDAPKVDNWRPPGVDLCDRIADHFAALDRAERVRELGEAAAIKKAEAELAKQPEPKERKDKGTK